MRVLAALNRVGADLGDPIEVSRAGGEILVSGVGIEPQRQQEIKDALRSHRDGPLSVCCHGEQAAAFADQAATLASIVIDLGQPAMTIAGGQPCTSEYADAGPLRSPAAAG